MINDKVLDRIYGLFAQDKLPKFLTKKEREYLEDHHADIDWQVFGYKSHFKQSKKETEVQTLARFEKALNGALKKAKSLLAQKSIKNISINAGHENRIEITGSKIMTDADLIKEEHTDWESRSRREAKESKEKEVSQAAATKIAEQNELIKELVSLLKKPAKARKTSK